MFQVGHRDFLDLKNLYPHFRSGYNLAYRYRQKVDKGLVRVPCLKVEKWSQSFVDQRSLHRQLGRVFSCRSWRVTLNNLTLIIGESKLYARVFSQQLVCLP
ncbi:hypothetical protein QTP88_020369 [Uroleucon formosanum]